MVQERSFYRSRTSRIIGGVCGGLSEKLNFDVSLIRLIFVLLVVFGGGGLLIYLILWIIVPEKPWSSSDFVNSIESESYGQPKPTFESSEKNESSFEMASGSNFNLIIGLSLVSAGVLFLLSNFVSWLNLRDLWPLVLIIAGIALLFSNIKNSTK